MADQNMAQLSAKEGEPPFVQEDHSVPHNGEGVITPASPESSGTRLSDGEKMTAEEHEEWHEENKELFNRLSDEGWETEKARREDARKRVITSMNSREETAVGGMFCLSQGGTGSRGKKKTARSKKKRSAAKKEKECQLFSTPEAQQIVKIPATDQEVDSDLMKIHGVKSDDLATPE